MKRYFTETGHLTTEALTDVTNHVALSELERLEIAEHLSFCDACLEQYALLLTDEHLCDPTACDFSKQTAKKIHQKRCSELLTRYIPAAAAACFALFLWISGVFTPQMNSENKFVDTVIQSSAAFSQKTNELGAKFSQQMQKIFSFDFREVLQSGKK